MGIDNLQKFFDKNLSNDKCIQSINTKILEDKVVAIDISIYLYQFLCAIKNNSVEIYSIDGQIITHIHAILNKVFGLIKKKIKPIFVFDGKPPTLKDDILNIRSKNKVVSENKKIKLIKQSKLLKLELNIVPKSINDVKHQLKLFKEYKEILSSIKKMNKRTIGISKTQFKECKQLLELLGIPYLNAIEEADPQCAELVKSNIAYAVASEDMDLLPFGTKHLLRKLSSKDICIIYDLDLILEDLEITYLQFIDICILLGCDYTCTIKGLGREKILKEIKTFKNIEGIIKSSKYSVSKKFNYIDARKQFLKPKIIENLEKIEWKIPDYKGLEDFLQKKFSYNVDEINKIHNLLRTGYYSVICGEQDITQWKKDYNNKTSYRKTNLDSDED